MINDLKQGKQIVKQVLSECPDARDNDTLLLIKVWEIQGYFIPTMIRTHLIFHGFKPESVRRWRQKLQENGQFLGTKRLQKMGEADRVKDFIQAESE